MDFHGVPIRSPKRRSALLDKLIDYLILKRAKLSCNPPVLMVYGRSFSCRQYEMSGFLRSLSVVGKFRAIYNKEEMA
jgi:hypothetical protein